MRPGTQKPHVARRALVTLGALAVLALPGGAVAAPGSGQQHSRARQGALAQLGGPGGCLVDRSAPATGCATARALKGPGPFMGSRAIALSPDGRNVYVASSRSDAIAVFRRNPRTGKLTQPRGAAGCIAAKGAAHCATAIGLDGPNSVAVSPDGRNVYATARGANTIGAFHRNRSTGALTQLPPAPAASPDCPCPSAPPAGRWSVPTWS